VQFRTAIWTSITLPTHRSSMPLKKFNRGGNEPLKGGRLTQVPSEKIAAIWRRPPETLSG
jgi:hypothetical protein